MKESNSIKRLIAKGETGKAIELFKSSLEPNSFIERKVILLESEFNKIRKEKLLGIDEDSKAENRLNSKLLNLIHIYSETTGDEDDKQANFLADKKVLPLIGSALIIILGLIGLKTSYFGSIVIFCLGIYYFIKTFLSPQSANQTTMMLTSVFVIIYGIILFNDFENLAHQSPIENILDIDINPDDSKLNLALGERSIIVALTIAFLSINFYQLFKSKSQNEIN